MRKLKLAHMERVHAGPQDCLKREMTGNLQWHQLLTVPTPATICLQACERPQVYQVQNYPYSLLNS